MMKILIMATLMPVKMLMIMMMIRVSMIVNNDNGEDYDYDENNNGINDGYDDSKFHMIVIFYYFKRFTLSEFKAFLMSAKSLLKRVIRR